MNTLQRITPSRSTKNYWMKVYLKDPYAVKVLGPYISLEDALAAQTRLENEGQMVVSCFPLAPLSPPIMPKSPMSHTQWLQGLMEDYLHVKVP